LNLLSDRVQVDLFAGSSKTYPLRQEPGLSEMQLCHMFMEREN